MLQMYSKTVTSPKDRSNTGSPQVTIVTEPGIIGVNC